MPCLNKAVPLCSVSRGKQQERSEVLKIHTKKETLKELQRLSLEKRMVGETVVRVFRHKRKRQRQNIVFNIYRDKTRAIKNNFQLSRSLSVRGNLNYHLRFLCIFIFYFCSLEESRISFFGGVGLNMFFLSWWFWGSLLTENLVRCNIKRTLHHCTLLLGVHIASFKCSGNYFSNSFGPNYWSVALEVLSLTYCLRCGGFLQGLQ